LVEGARSVKKALDIIDCFSFEKVEFGITELSSTLNMPKSTVSRLVGELVEKGFLEQNSDTKKFKLGLKLFYLGSIVLKKMKLTEVALPIMHKIRDELVESIHLNIIKDNERMCLAYVECDHDLRPFVHVGQRSPLYAGASAKILLAFMKDQEIDEVIKRTRLARITESTICDTQTLIKEIMKIRQKGYAFSNGERIPGLVSISTPIRNYTGKVVASIAVALPEVRFSQDDLERIIGVLKKGAEKISFLLGWNIFPGN